MKDPALTVAHEAQAQILTGDAWLSYLRRTLLQDHPCLLISMYMISPWWNTATHDRSILGLLCHETDHIPLRHCLLCAMPPALAVRNYNLRAAQRLLDGGWQLRSTPQNHEKLWLIGNTIAIIGSHNVSFTSATSNSDCSVALTSKPLVRSLMARYWSKWAMAKNFVTSGPTTHGADRLDQLTPVTRRKV